MRPLLLVILKQMNSLKLQVPSFV